MLFGGLKLFIIHQQARQSLAKYLLPTGQNFAEGRAGGNITVKNAIPLSEKYRTEAVTQFAQNPDADVRYSIPSVDRYTEKQYNNFGWVRANDVLTAAEYSDLISNYTGHKHTKDNYPITRFGETVIHSAQYTDILMYVKGPIKNPQITKVVRINDDNAYILSKIKEELLKLEREQAVSPFSFIRDVYGEEILSIDRLRDYASFQEFQRRRKGKNSTNDDNSNRAERDGTGSIKENKRTDRADPIDGPAYSLPKKNNTQYSIPDIAKGKSYTELDQLVKEGKITSDEAFAALGKQFGTMPKGENPKVDVTLPEQISKTKNVNQFMRNVLESGQFNFDMLEKEDALKPQE